MARIDRYESEEVRIEASAAPEQPRRGADRHAFRIRGWFIAIAVSAIVWAGLIGLIWWIVASITRVGE